MKKINLCESDKIILYKEFLNSKARNIIASKPMIESCEICGDKLENVLFDWSIGQLYVPNAKLKILILIFLLNI